MKFLYKYPQKKFPYKDLIDEGNIAKLCAIRARRRDLNNGDIVENRRKFGEMILENPALIGGVLGFAFLAVVIISNAAFLQVERHPAPIFGSGDWSPAMSSHSNSVPVPRRQPLLIQDIQQALADRGYCFVVAGVRDDLTVQDVFKGVTPFFIADAITIALLVAFPGIVLYLPSLAG